MECPFELPVKSDEELLMLHINGKLRAAMIIGDVDDWDNEKRLLYLRYIVQAINSHEKLKDENEKLKIDLLRIDNYCRTNDIEIEQALEAEKKE